MKVLVTGGSGFIGSNVVDELAARGHEVEILVRTRKLHLEDSAHTVRLGDVRDHTTVSEAVGHSDAWIHLAGVLGTTETIKDPWPAIDTNMRAAYNVLEAASKYNRPGVNIAVGNWWMNNPYSITKNLAERFCLMYRDERDVNVSVVRALNAYGPGQSIAQPYGHSQVRKITPSFVCRALVGDPIEVYGNGQQIMDMAHVKDVARVLVATLEQTVAEGPAPHVLEAGTGLDTTVLDVAEAVIKATGQGEVKYLPMRPGEPEGAVVQADPRTLTWLHEAQSFRSLEVGIPETVEWYRTNWLPGYGAK